MNRLLNSLPEDPPSRWSLILDALGAPYFTKGYIRPGCSAFYVVNSPNLGVQGVVSACCVRDFARRYKKNYGEMFRLMNRESVDEAFVKCIVGYDLDYEEGRGGVDNQFDSLHLDRHLIFDVLFSTLKRK